MTDYKTCTHTYDSGRACKSAAAKDREFCGYHLRYRGRLLRMAQSRARHQSFDLTMPPLDSLCSIQSALSEVAEALAADMIDPRRALVLLKMLRFAKENLKDGLQDDHAHWHDTPYHSEDASAYDNFETEYGLPEGIDPSTPPEVAFPPPAPPSSDLSSRAQDAVSAVGAEGPAFFPGNAKFPSFDRAPLIPEIPPPYQRDYDAEFANYEYTPEDIELTELYNTRDYKAWDSRCKEHQRNSDRKQRRRLFRANYARYVAEAKLKNIQRAAEKLIAERLAAEKAATADAANPEPTASFKKQPASVAEDQEAVKKTA